MNIGQLELNADRARQTIRNRAFGTIVDLIEAGVIRDAVQPDAFSGEIDAAIDHHVHAGETPDIEIRSQYTTSGNPVGVSFDVTADEAGALRAYSAAMAEDE